MWQKYLRIRKCSQHAQCTTCFELQRQMHGARNSIQSRLTAARALQIHYRDQYADRCLYWSMRHASRLRENVLVIIIDSMDKTKFAWPRYPWRTPKELSDFIRPRLVLTAAMAHGYCTCLYLASERINHGTDGYLEILSSTIEQVRLICQERGWDMPEHLVIQTDNTVSQSKNSASHIFAALLVAWRMFKTITTLRLI